MRQNLLVLLVFLVFGAYTAPLNSNEEEAQKFAEQASEKLYANYDKLIKDTLSLDNKGFGEMLETIGSLIKTAEALVEIVNESKKFDITKFKDEKLKHIFKTIRRSAYEVVVGKDEYLEMINSLQMLEELSTDTDIPLYKNNSVVIAYYPDIQNIIVKSNDPEELKYYWNEWRKKNAAWAVSHFVTLVKGLKHAANITDMLPTDYWLNEYDVKQMEHVMEQIKPFYLQLHAFVRNQLNKKYGYAVVKVNESIPDHLFQQVLAQTWTDNSIIDDIFPHKDLPPYDEILMKNNYNADKLFKTADQFYQSLGFEPVPDDFWGTRFKMSENEDEGDCRASIFDESPNVYMHYCQKVDFRKFLQAHGYMARIYYAREKKNLPAYYFPSHDLEYPVGEAVILSASTPKHLKALDIITDFKFTKDVMMNRLLRMSIHTFLNIPVYFVHTKLMVDLFDGAIEMPDINKHYWKLMDKYVGVGPPTDRVDDTFDFPFKFYIDLNSNRQAQKFNSEVLGYQFYKKMCQISGHNPKEQLNECDFYGNKDAGNSLKSMMELGSSKPLREILQTCFPVEKAVDAGSLLEYYADVKTWLTDKNRESNVNVGWTKPDKKIETVFIADEETKIE